MSSLKHVFSYQGAKPGSELLNLLLVAGAVQTSLHDAISGLPVSGRQAIKMCLFFHFPHLSADLQLKPVLKSLENTADDRYLNKANIPP